MVARFLSSNEGVTDPIDDANFEFYGKTLRRGQLNSARWKRTGNGSGRPFG
jgi:predicted metalloendopeptidase